MVNSIAAAAAGAIVRERSHPAYQAYRILQAAFTIAPIVAGIDKFTHLLTNWDQYLAPWIAAAVPVSGHQLMLAAGIVEIAAGILVLLRPRVFAPIVGAWLCLIVIDLISMGAYLDVALRDLGLALGAFALGRLAVEFEPDRRSE